MSGGTPERRPTFDDLDALPTDRLRELAFERARQRHDVGFFISVLRHLPAAEDTEMLNSSLGSVGASLDDLVAMWREMEGHGYGEAEPLLRAKFIDYLLGGGTGDNG